MSDLISRQALCEYALNQKDKSITPNEIMRFPSAEPQWTPCSKRMPEKMGLYLVTLEYKEHGKGVTTLWYHGEQIGWDLRVADVVIAWMPLPAAYEKEKN